MSVVQAEVSPLGQLRAMGLDLAKSTKDAGLDFIYAIDARLKDLHGGAENWRYLFDKGKLSVLSALGSMEESRDAAYDRRRHAIVTTRRLVTSIEKEYSAVVAALGSLGEHHAALCTLLNQFRRECDLHIATSAEEPPSDGDDDDATALPAGSTQTSSPSTGRRAARGDSDFVTISSSEREALRSVADDDVMQKFEQRMKAMFAELNETVKGSCLGISRTSIQQIDEAYVKITSAVDRAQTAFDVKRRETTVIAREVEALKAELSELAKKQQQQHHQSGHHSSSKAAGKSSQLEQKELELSERCNEQERLLVVYRAAVREGMKNLHFALEQVSMSTWSTYNIFFSQLGNFFEEATCETRKAAKALVELKNAQNVARVISDEKKQRLARAAVLSAVAATSTGAHATTTTASSVAGLGSQASTAAPAPALRPTAPDELDLLLSERAQSLGAHPTPPPPVTSAPARNSQSPPDWEELFGN